MANLKDLPLALMVRISEGWLDAKRSRPLLEKLSSGKALVARVETVLNDLLTTQKQDSKATKELAALLVEEGGLDRRHDRVLRGLYWILTGLAELAETPEEEAAYLAVRDELFPNGLSMTQRSYAEEAGEIPLAQARLTDGSKALLKKIPLPKGKLWDAVERWFGLGRDIGHIEEKRRTLEAAVAGTDGSGTSRAEAMKARNRWIKLARHIETTLDLDDIDDEARKAIVGGLEDAIKAVSKRAPDKGATGDDPNAKPESTEKPPQ